MITDAQIHLWEADTAERPWPPGVQADVEPPLTAERFIPMMDEAGVARALISPPGASGFDPTYALECAQRYPDRLAVTSRWTLDDPKGPERLPTWLDQPGMIGIRFAILPSNLERWRDSGQLARFWADAERYDIPLMVFAPGTLPEVGHAARRHPGLKLIVDHVNLMNSTPETVGERVDALNELAQFPNVGVKLGALPIRSATRYPFTDLHAPLRRVYEAFGAQRLMWASDQTTTMAKDKASYSENLNLIREAALGDIPSADMERILGGTVSEWFRWRA